MSAERVVTLAIDGQELTVRKGTRVMAAADSIGIHIPRFCYHASLSVLGACRVCLVQVFTPVIDRATGEPVCDAQSGEIQYREMPTLQTSCTLECTPGMRVVTDSEKVRQGRESIIEFILANHPLDCPVCDKGGECELQEMTMLCGPARQRFSEPRLHQDKARRIGASIVLDQERCIVCFRCTRFLSEWASEQVFEFHERGGHSVIEPALKEPIAKARFAGNTIDLCPVGALTSDYYRFSARPWELGNTPGVCPHCAVGCNLTLGGRLGTLCRVEPRTNHYVNGSWICDRGRYDYEWVQRNRIVVPEVGRGDESQPAEWDQVLAEAVSALSGVEGMAAVVDPATSCEAGFLVQRLLRAGLRSGTMHIEDEYDLAGPFSGSITDLMYSDLVVLISANTLDDQPVLWLRANRRYREGRTSIIAIGPEGWAPDLERLAADHATMTGSHEVALLGGLVRLLHTQDHDTLVQVASETGVDPAWLSSFVGTIRTAERPAVIVGRLPRDQYGPARGMLSRLLEALQSGRRMPVAGGILVGGANSRGLRMVGCSSAALPGAEPLPKPWREALVAGDLEALLVVGGDPLAGSSPDVMDAARALSSLVYVGTNHNTTSALATLRMAAASFAEEPLTYVNFEGRLQESVPTNEPIGRTWTTYRILGRLCAAVGAWQGELTADSVRRAIAESQPGLQPWAGPIGEQGEML